MLSAKYIHFKWTKTGILDYIFDLYEARNERSAISFEEWIATEYDYIAVQEEFLQKKKPIF